MMKYICHPERSEAKSKGVATFGVVSTCFDYVSASLRSAYTSLSMTYLGPSSPQHITTRPGAMMLMTVLVAGAVALTVGLSLALRGIGELDMGIAESQSLETFAIAEGCIDEALLRLSHDVSYMGESLSLGDGDCTISVTIDGSERIINVTATMKRWTRKIKVRVDLAGPQVTILEWQQDPT